MYAAQGIMHSRAPDNLFALESLKDIYTFNFASVIIQYVALKIIKVIIGIFKKDHKLLKTVYAILNVKTLWWTILIGMLETNIAPIAFYTTVQFN